MLTGLIFFSLQSLTFLKNNFIDPFLLDSFEKFDAENVESNGGHLVTRHNNTNVLLNCRLMLDIDGSFLIQLGCVCVCSAILSCINHCH